MYLSNPSIYLSIYLSITPCGALEGFDSDAAKVSGYIFTTPAALEARGRGAEGSISLLPSPRRRGKGRNECGLNGRNGTGRTRFAARGRARDDDAERALRQSAPARGRVRGADAPDRRAAVRAGRALGQLEVCNGVESNRTEPNRIESNRIESNGMEWDGLAWHGIEWHMA